MKREEILSVVKKQLITVVDSIEEDQVDAKVSMKDLGASSLDIVEVVSNSMRELKIKIPRSELESVTNIEELVDALYSASAAGA